MDLAVRVHQLTRAAPLRFRFSLTERMNRAAISIPTNIAEGVGRHGCREFRRHVGITLGSLREIETQLLLAVRIGAFGAGDGAELLLIAAEVGRMLSRLEIAFASHLPLITCHLSLVTSPADRDRLAAAHREREWDGGGAPAPPPSRRGPAHRR